MIRAVWLATGVALTAHLAGANHALAAPALLAERRSASFGE